jgi:hypothetical protein
MIDIILPFLSLDKDSPNWWYQRQSWRRSRELETFLLHERHPPRNRQSGRPHRLARRIGVRHTRRLDEGLIS